ncbi:MAG: type II methionyl aminopeptidase [archaeon]|nr:MAG: type II methionyl aminopeptidase [archaeon]
MIPGEYARSGRITSEVRARVKEFVKPGTGYLEACRFVEEEISSRKGAPAFPVGIGVNHVTAHYSPQEKEASVFKESDLVKVDFGVHVDGYVTDTAVSVTFNPSYEPMLEASERALGVAIAALRKEQRAGEIGREIRKEVARLGFKTIENLTGHTVDRYQVHAGKSIPNLYVPGMQALRKGDVFAIEPFVTPAGAAGYVVDAPLTTIFSVVARKRIGTKELDAFVDKVWEERKTLPFTPRWYPDDLGGGKLDSVLGKLVAKKVVRSYPTLVEASGNPVAQFEHTVALTEGGPVVLT